MVQLIKVATKGYIAIIYLVYHSCSEKHLTHTSSTYCKQIE